MIATAFLPDADDRFEAVCLKFDPALPLGIASPLWRKLILPVAVFRLNLPIFFVNDQFGPLILRNLTRTIDSFCFAIKNLRSTLRTGTFDCPPCGMYDHMLIAFFSH